MVQLKYPKVSESYRLSANFTLGNLLLSVGQLHAAHYLPTIYKIVYFTKSLSQFNLGTETEEVK